MAPQQATRTECHANPSRPLLSSPAVVNLHLFHDETLKRVAGGHSLALNPHALVEVGVVLFLVFVLAVHREALDRSFVTCGQQLDLGRLSLLYGRSPSYQEPYYFQYIYASKISIFVSIYTVFRLFVPLP